MIHPICTCFRIDGLKAMSHGNSGGKQVINLANMSNGSQFCVFSQDKTTILVMQNVQFELQHVLHHYF